MKPIIKVENLSKRYKIGEAKQPYSTLRESLVEAVKSPFKKFRKDGEENTFWALNDVSFEVMPGEVVGIIGRNGAGKSTLLKVLSRITEPTKGKIELYGRVASLLEVGTGFHPELTGRENIFLNGAILGMKRSEIARKFDEIVDFAEIEKFIDTPVKRYSSGMYVRLAFAVAASLEPEILIVDEVLAVGDANFQKKCLGKMGDVAKGGRTVLFVSHNMAAMQNLCKSGMFFENGTLRKASHSIQDVLGEYLTEPQQITKKDFQRFHFSEKLKVENISLMSEESEDVNHYFMRIAILKIDIIAKKHIRDFSCNVRLNSDMGINIVAWRTKETDERNCDLKEGKNTVFLFVEN